MQEAAHIVASPLTSASILFQRAPEAWPAGPTSPILSDNEVHVWRVDLERMSLANVDAALAENDRTQAARFRFEIDRQRFLIARASLRIILSQYLQLAPCSLEFKAGPQGKPELVASQTKIDLRFNLSHSRDLALIAISLGRDVGVDLEFMREDFAGDEIAERFFSQNEIAQLKTVAPELRSLAFFNCWTRKEAYIKARGDGLSFPLDQFDVSLSPDSRAALFGNRLDPTETARWDLVELTPAPDYVAAIAIEKGWRNLRRWSFDQDCNFR
jgi:4'-phosphopantetheinyl transferase